MLLFSFRVTSSTFFQNVLRIVSFLVSGVKAFFVSEPRHVRLVQPMGTGRIDAKKPDAREVRLATFLPPFS
jgi:hypothetical protein